MLAIVRIRRLFRGCQARRACGIFRDATNSDYCRLTNGSSPSIETRLLPTAQQENQCAFVSSLLAIRHLKSETLTDDLLRQIIDVDSAHLADQLRKEQHLGEGAFIGISDAFRFVGICTDQDPFVRDGVLMGNWWQGTELQILVDRLEASKGKVAVLLNRLGHFIFLGRRREKMEIRMS